MAVSRRGWRTRRTPPTPGKPRGYVLKVGQKVTVIDDARRKTKGTISLILSDSFTVAGSKGDRVFGWDIWRAQFKRDGLKNGLWAGVGLGLVASAIAAGRECAPPNDCTDYGGFTPFLFAPLTVPVGLSVGALVDWAIRHEEAHIEYRRAPVTAQLVPLRGGTAKVGLAIAVGF